MNTTRRKTLTLCWALALWSLTATAAWTQVAAPPPLAAPPAGIGDDGAEVLTRGPVHEAYAAPVATGSLTNVLIVPKQPPDPIEEVPPDAMPEGEDPIWISGYWAWDDDRTDFIWISGVWRVPPPDASWIAGYWTEADGGWRWVPGFWTPVETQEVSYQPEPPETLEQGPTSEPPTQQHFWIPGCWNWREARYAWRPGYWSMGHADWVWVPDSYYWTPRGWVFVSGYWDLPLARRGLPYCPVYFHGPVWRTPAYRYSPTVVVDTSLLTIHLFTRPRYHHYYFGDYYAVNSDRIGIYPWYAVNVNRHYHYDPLFSYYRWYNRGHDPRWEQHLRGWHSYFRQHEDLRPPHTMADMRQFDKRMEHRKDIDKSVVNVVRVAAPVKDIREHQHSHIRLTTVTDDRRREIGDFNRDLRELHDKRRQLEVQGRVPGKAKPDADRKGKPDTAQFPKGKPERVQLPKAPDPRRLHKTKELSDMRGPESKAKPGARGPGIGQPGAVKMPEPKHDRRDVTPPKSMDRPDGVAKPVAKPTTVDTPDSKAPDSKAPDSKTPDSKTPDSKTKSPGTRERRPPSRPDRPERSGLKDSPETPRKPTSKILDSTPKPSGTTRPVLSEPPAMSKKPDAPAKVTRPGIGSVPGAPSRVPVEPKPEKPVQSRPGKLDRSPAPMKVEPTVPSRPAAPATLDRPGRVEQPTRQERPGRLESPSRSERRPEAPAQLKRPETKTPTRSGTGDTPTPTLRQERPKSESRPAARTERPETRPERSVQSEPSRESRSPSGSEKRREESRSRREKADR